MGFVYRVVWSHFFFITETARLPGTELGTENSQYSGYIIKPAFEIEWIHIECSE